MMWADLWQTDSICLNQHQQQRHRLRLIVRMQQELGERVRGILQALPIVSKTNIEGQGPRA
jgi:hypothetical protein